MGPPLVVAGYVPMRCGNKHPQIQNGTCDCMLGFASPGSAVQLICGRCGALNVLVVPPSLIALPGVLLPTVQGSVVTTIAANSA